MEANSQFTQRDNSTTEEDSKENDDDEDRKTDDNVNLLNVTEENSEFLA
jgi:hypothetical protein